MTFELTPCSPWTDVATVQACDAYSGLDAAALATPISVASELLFKLSGYQFLGTCSTVVRPAHCRRYSNVYEFDTGIWPVRTVTQILVDGAPMDLSNVRIDDGRWLIREDGLHWPTTQRFDLPTTEQGTWSIALTFGQDPPPSGELAASTFAGELGLACGTADQCQKCRLPKRVQQFTRQGVSAVMIDPFQFLENGKLGIFEVDAFLTAYNPENLQGDPVVASPDVRPAMVRTTWP